MLQCCHRATRSLTERTTNSRKHTRKRMRLTQCAQKITQQGHARRGWGTWPGMRRERQMGPRRRKKKKMRKVITSSCQGTLLGEVTAGQKKARREHASQRAENLDGYATGMADETGEDEEEENSAGNIKQPTRNSVRGSHGWES